MPNVPILTCPKCGGRTFFLAKGENQGKDIITITCSGMKCGEPLLNIFENDGHMFQKFPVVTVNTDPVQGTLGANGKIIETQTESGIVIPKKK